MQMRQALRGQTLHSTLQSLDAGCSACFVLYTTGAGDGDGVHEQRFSEQGGQKRSLAAQKHPLGQLVAAAH